MLTYDTTELLVMKQIRYLYSALLSSLYFVSHLLETIHHDIFYLFSSESQSMGETSPCLPLLLQAGHYNSCKFQISLGCSNQHNFIAVTSDCVPGLVEQLLKKTTQRSVLRLDSSEWTGAWDSVGKCLGQWAPPAFWNFPLSKCRIQKNWENTWKKDAISLAIPERPKSLQYAGSWPTKPSPTLFRILKGTKPPWI